VLIPKGRFFKAIFKYFIKDTSFLETMNINPFRRNDAYKPILVEAMQIDPFP